VPTDLVLYEAADGVATLTLNRPQQRNTVNPELADALDAQLARARADRDVRVIRIRGAGSSFCAGYDITWGAQFMADNEGDEPWDAVVDYQGISRYVETYMSLWRSPKPVVAQVHGFCVGGGSDMALCADLIVCADDCRIGYPPARVWGVPTTAMWVHRLGLERAKRLLLTGDPIDGATAAAWGFACASHPAEELDAAALALAKRMARLPANQLAMMKMAVNSAIEQMGLQTSQLIGTLLDGAARHTPEGVAFSRAATEDLRRTIVARDAPFGDYGQGDRTATSPPEPA
jgi:enoyl-CoA hydratase